jgi:hypothetical protein
MENDNANEKLSLKDCCWNCNAHCCLHGGTPIACFKEVRVISKKGNKNYFKNIKGTLGEDYFIIGYNQDGTDRNLDSGPCPYLLKAVYALFKNISL